MKNKLKALECAISDMKFERSQMMKAHLKEVIERDIEFLNSNEFYNICVLSSYIHELEELHDKIKKKLK